MDFFNTFTDALWDVSHYTIRLWDKVKASLNTAQPKCQGAFPVKHIRFSSIHNKTEPLASVGFLLNSHDQLRGTVCLRQVSFYCCIQPIPPPAQVCTHNDHPRVRFRAAVVLRVHSVFYK